MPLGHNAFTPLVASLSIKDKVEQLRKIQAFKNDMLKTDGVMDNIDAAIIRVPDSVSGSAAENNAAYESVFTRMNHMKNGLIGVVCPLDPSAKAEVNVTSSEEEAALYPDRQVYLNHENLLSPEELMKAGVSLPKSDQPVHDIANALDQKQEALEAALRSEGLNADDIINWTDAQKVENGIRDEPQWNALNDDLSNAKASGDAAAINKAQIALDDAVQAENAALVQLADQVRIIQMNVPQEKLAERIKKVDEKTDTFSLAEKLANAQHFKPGFGKSSPQDYSRGGGWINVHYSMRRDPKNPGVTALGIPIWPRSLNVAGLFVGSFLRNTMQLQGLGAPGALQRPFVIDSVHPGNFPGSMLNFLADTCAVAELMGGKVEIRWDELMKGQPHHVVAAFQEAQMGVNWQQRVEESKQRVRDKTNCNPGESLADALGRKYVGKEWYQKEDKVNAHDYKAAETKLAEADPEVALAIGEPSGKPKATEPAALGLGESSEKGDSALVASSKAPTVKVK